MSAQSLNFGHRPHRPDQEGAQSPDGRLEGGRQTLVVRKEAHVDQHRPAVPFEIELIVFAEEKAPRRIGRELKLLIEQQRALPGLDSLAQRGPE